MSKVHSKSCRSNAPVFIQLPMSFIYNVVVFVFISCSVTSNSMRPHGLQPTRILCAWDFQCKNTRVGCHSLLQGIFQAKILEWVAIPFSRGSSWPGDWTWVFCIAGRFFTIWATREAHAIHLQPSCILLLLLLSPQVMSDSVWPIDGSPPGSSAPGILQARKLEWFAISFSSAWKWKVKVKLLSRVWLFTIHGLQPTRLLCPWDFPGKSTGMGCHSLLQEIFQTWGLKLGLLHCRQILYHLSHQGSSCH